MLRSDADISAEVAGASGFTLIEVLVALAIAALALVMFAAAVGTGLGNAALANQYIEATRRAQSRLALVGTAFPLVPSDQSGDDGGGFSWRVRISAPAQHTTVPSAGQTVPAAYTVEVSISWHAGAKLENVTLQTQRLGLAVAGNG